MTGYFKSNFWSHILLQTTHLEPAVRHAVVSIGSIHEQYEAGNAMDETQTSGAFALQQYNTAISHLVNAAKKQEQQTADVILMSCLLFISFEMLRANFGSSLYSRQIRAQGSISGKIQGQRGRLQSLSLCSTPDSGKSVSTS